jgi:hypothetical protein
MQTSALATTDNASRALATKGATALDLIDVMEDLLKVGRFFVESGMMPPGVNTASKAALIIWKGHELGIKPLQAVTGINVIQGRPSIAPQLMLNKIIQSKEAEFFKFVESTNERCTIHAKRKNGLEIIETFSMEDADRIMSKEDNKVIPLSQKSNYRNQPKIMLRWRCVSAVGRIIFPDVIEGCHTPDELEDEQVPFDEIIPEPSVEMSSQTESGPVVDAVYETSQGNQAQETAGDVQPDKQPGTAPAAKQESAAPSAEYSTAPIKLVSPAQAKALVKAIKENGINEAEFLKKHDIAAVESLPASLFQETLKVFNASKETATQASQQEASKAAEEKKSATITAEQLKELQSIIDKLGPDYDTSKLFAHFKIKTLNELPADNYNFVHETLAKKLAA